MKYVQSDPRWIAGPLAVSALVVSLGVTGAAVGQFGDAAGFGEVMSPYFQRRDLIHFVETLSLDDGQSVILESLFWDYEDAQYEGRDRMTQRIAELRPQLEKLDKNQIMQLIFEPFEDRSAEWDYLNDQFLESLRAILNDRQLGQWGTFDRTIRREKELDTRRCRLSGEGLNLFHILNEINVGQRTRASIQGVLDEYAAQVDAALRHRQDLFREHRIQMMHAIRDEQIEASMQIYQRQIDARVAVRNVNDEFTTAIARALPAEIGEELYRTALERAYPRIYRPTPAQRVFEAAKAMDGLDEETLQAVVDLEAAYLIELTVINDSIHRLLREFEPQDELYRAMAFSLRRTGQRPDRPEDATRPEFRRRDELGRRYMERLRELLTPEKFSQLPGAQRFHRNPAGSGTAAGSGKKKTPGGSGSLGRTAPMKRKGPKDKGGKEEEGER